ncbi:hemin uptake protein HemP [Prosthecomicrobium pneumaticum]|uniref:Hemin uptake protein HemP n=1 Tax=Prosthecomicrobium pneumaticum TaxID=81895 RepID=A0A7W9L206_9HYPH|nr:hemin uptake protein HemP [Prosthecomicrobium pneumaticum]MBB5753098.1 hemin uptake protein HemP [Prosthecomicrobium pneumaticum]
MAEPDRSKGDGAPLRSVTSEALLAGERELAIHHGPAEYRLRVTRAGKLILTKAPAGPVPAFGRTGDPAL